MDKQQLSDGDISRGCRQNDPKAWRHLIRANTALVYRIAMRMLRDRRDAEDASQEVFMRVYRSIESHDPTRPIAPWISKITYNACLKRISKKNGVEKKEFALSTDNPAEEISENTPEIQLTKKQMANTIEKALDRISAQDRALIAMRYSEGFTDSEIAESTDMPVGTVKTRLHRARGKLRKILAPFIREVST
jgi:RNA polymerase sigma-70 factor (ECF subfamily)